MNGRPAVAVPNMDPGRFGTGTGEQSDYGNLFLTLHVGFVLAAFAGFTLAAALALLYLLKLPSLVTLEKVTSNAIAVSLPLLTLGLAIGIVRLYRHGGSFDALMAATILAWLVYGAFLALRPTGRAAAHLALAGFAVVIVVRIVLAGSHF